MIALALHAGADGYAAEPGHDHPSRVLWGDTHLHTSYSSDAFLFGNRKLTPEQAYRFARGNVVLASNGNKAQLRQPLDFVVIADHAENLGMMAYIDVGNPAVMSTPNAERWRTRLAQIGTETGAFMRIFAELGNPELQDEKARNAIWRDYVSLADTANTPGVFTTLVGFEWTSTPGGNNLHRVVIFRDGVGMADQVLPFAEFNSQHPEDLWTYLSDYQTRTGGEVLAIPHNSNGSNGQMFPATMRDGRNIDKGYADTRRRWEPLIEVTQIKGDMESHPLLSPDDEFAGYSVWDKGNLIVSQRKDPAMLAHEYARSALRSGLEIAQQTGSNPYQFGLIGSTDSHTSLSTADDNNFWGGTPDNEPAPGRLDRVLIPSSIEHGMDVMSWEQEASGYAAVWARDNTRQEIFDALQRREVYASTGPRITLRFFGGWQFSANDHLKPNYVDIGYELGVPMGGELRRPSPSKSPTFMVAALKDPNGANLDRLQIVKGWLDKDGNSQERVYDVAWSEHRTTDASGRLSNVGSTVDPVTATYTNAIGASELATVWTDPEFDPQARAFYYVRALEIPTPRWVLHDAVRFGASVPTGARTIHQERAYGSPIWYSP